MIMVIKITSAYCNSNIDNANANTTANVNAAIKANAIANETNC